MTIGRFCLLLATAIFIFAPSTSHGITLGQVDTFEGGNQGWLGYAQQNGIGVQTGTNDQFFYCGNAGSSGIGPLEVLNQLQWSGNYIAANVTSIEMDLKSTSLPFIVPTLPIRIAIPESNSRDGKTASYSSII